MSPFEQKYLERDSQQLGYHRYRADTDTAVIVLPAMGVPAGYYKRFATALWQTGTDVTVADLRGTGASRPRATRTAKYGYAELVDDIETLFSRLAPELSGRKILLIGHSLGGHIATLHLARRQARPQDHPLSIAGLCLIACGIPYHALYGWRSPMIYGMASSMTHASRLLGHWPGYGFAGRQSRGIIRDWAHTVHKGRFVHVHGEDLEPALSGIKLPLLAVTVDGDQFTPPQTIAHLTDKLSSAQVTTHHYGATEAGAPLDHFKWAKASAPLIEQLSAFHSSL